MKISEKSVNDDQTAAADIRSRTSRHTKTIWTSGRLSMDGSRIHVAVQIPQTPWPDAPLQVDLLRAAAALPFACVACHGTRLMPPSSTLDPRNRGCCLPGSTDPAAPYPCGTAGTPFSPAISLAKARAAPAPISAATSPPEHGCRG